MAVEPDREYEVEMHYVVKTTVHAKNLEAAGDLLGPWDAEIVAKSPVPIRCNQLQIRQIDPPP